MFKSLRLGEAEIQRHFEAEVRKSRLERLKKVKEQSKEFNKHVRFAYSKAKRGLEKKLVADSEKENAHPGNTALLWDPSCNFGEGIINALVAVQEEKRNPEDEIRKANVVKSKLRGRKALKLVLLEQQRKCNYKLQKLENARNIEKIRSSNIVTLGRLRDLYEEESLLLNSFNHSEGGLKSNECRSKKRERLRGGECAEKPVSRVENADLNAPVDSLQFSTNDLLNNAYLGNQTIQSERNQIMKHPVVEAVEFTKWTEKEIADEVLNQGKRRVKASRRGAKAIQKERVYQKYNNLLTAIDELDRENNLEDLFVLEVLQSVHPDGNGNSRGNLSIAPDQQLLCGHCVNTAHEESLNPLAQLSGRLSATRPVLLNDSPAFNDSILTERPQPVGKTLLTNNSPQIETALATDSISLTENTVLAGTVLPADADYTDDKRAPCLSLSEHLNGSLESLSDMFENSDSVTLERPPNQKKSSYISSLTQVSSLSYKELLEQLLNTSQLPRNLSLSSSSSTKYLSLPDDILDSCTLEQTSNKSRPSYKIPCKFKFKPKRKLKKKTKTTSVKKNKKKKRRAELDCAMLKDPKYDPWKFNFLDKYIRTVLEMKPVDIRNLSVSSISSVGSIFSIAIQEDTFIPKAFNMVENDVELKDIPMESSVETKNNEEMVLQAPSESSSDSSLKHCLPIGSESVETVLPSSKDSASLKPNAAENEAVNVHDFLNSAQWDAFLRTMCQNILKNQSMTMENQASMPDPSEIKDELEKLSDGSLGFGTENSCNDSVSADICKRSEGLPGGRKSGGDDFELQNKPYWLNKAEERQFDDVDHISNEKYEFHCNGFKTSSSADLSSRRQPGHPISDTQSSSYLSSSKDFDVFSGRPSTPLPVADVQSVVTEIYSAYKKLKKILDVSLRSSKQDAHCQSFRSKPFVKELNFREKNSRSRCKSKAHTTHQRSRTCAPSVRRSKPETRYSDENVTTVEVFRKQTCLSPLFSKFAVDEESSSDKPFPSQFKLVHPKVGEPLKGKHVKREGKKLLSDIINYKHEKHKTEEMLPKSESAPPLKTNTTLQSFNRPSRKCPNIGTGLYHNDHTEKKDMSRKLTSDSQKHPSHSRPRSLKQLKDKISLGNGYSSRDTGKRECGGTNVSPNELSFLQYCKGKNSRKNRVNKASDHRQDSTNASDILNTVFNKLTSGLLRGDGSCVSCSRARSLSPTGMASVVSAAENGNHVHQKRGDQFSNSTSMRNVPARNLQQQFEEMAKTLKFDGFIEAEDNMESLSEFSSVSDLELSQIPKPKYLEKDRNVCIRVREFQNWIAGIQDKSIHDSKKEGVPQRKNVSSKKQYSLEPKMCSPNGNSRDENFGNLSSITMASHQDYKLSSFSSDGSLEANYEKGRSSRVLKSSSFRVTPPSLYRKDINRKNSSSTEHESSGSKRIMYSLQATSSTSINMR